MDIGKKIKRRRQELEMTQEELAKRLGYTSTAAICRVESNKDNITRERLKKLADALDTTVEYLLADEKTINEDNKIAYDGFVESRQVFVEAKRKDEEKIERIFEYAKRLSRLPDETRKAIELLIDNASK